MPRRSIFSSLERSNLLALPDNNDDLIRYYTLNEQDISIILQHRGAENRLGFAIQLCYMRYPGIMLGIEEPPFLPLLHYVSSQLNINPDVWGEYGQRPQTRREHLRELQMLFGFKPFSTTEHYQKAVDGLGEISKQTDKGIILANALIGDLRDQSILLPPITVIERICAEAITRSERQLYKLFTESLSEEQYRQLDQILNVRENSNISTLTWLRQSPGAPTPKHLLEHIERLKALEKLALPYGIERQAHQNRLLKLAREGGQMTPQHFQDLEAARRYATLELPDATITESGLKITPLDNSVPEGASVLFQQAYGLLPHVKITELLMEVDGWTDFTRCFTHIKNGGPPTDRILLLTAILADAINLGFTKMSESCPDVTYTKLSWLQAWHIRDETYTSALAELVNAQLRHPFSKNWGEGDTSSSDGQWFKVGGHAEAIGNVNPKYGSEPGLTFYTHISDQYAPFHTNVLNVPLRDATYVLDGLLYHESDLRVKEHYTDTAGFTDHVFALMHLLGFRFAPRIRDLADKRLYVPKDRNAYAEINVLIGGTINEKQIHSQWDEILRLAASIKQGTVTASLMLRKLGGYRRQNGLAVALRELGRIERSLFMLDWMQNVELRRRVQSGLNKGESKNALARAVFFNRLGEIRDRSFENQRYRASGLNLVTAAIILWNTVYLERAVQALQEYGQITDLSLLRHLSPLGWNHINLNPPAENYRFIGSRTI